MMSHTAYCFASGEIEIGTRTPEGALAFAIGTEPKLRALVEVTARHAYDGKTLLVPGIPEAANQIAAVEALMAWCDWLREGRRDGVVIVGGRRRRRATACGEA